MVRRLCKACRDGARHDALGHHDPTTWKGKQGRLGVLLL